MTYGMADVMGLLRLLDGGETTDRQRRIERQKIEALIGYCEAVSCRRQILLGYFGKAITCPAAIAIIAAHRSRAGTERSPPRRRFRRSTAPDSVSERATW